jgi:hypothetical protein
MGSHDFLAGVAWNGKDFNVSSQSEVTKVHAADWRAVEAGRHRLTSRPSRIACGEVGSGRTGWFSEMRETPSLVLKPPSSSSVALC